MAIKTNAAKIISSDKKDIPSNYFPAGDSDNGVGYLISFAKKTPHLGKKFEYEKRWHHARRQG